MACGVRHPNCIDGLMDELAIIAALIILSAHTSSILHPFIALKTVLIPDAIVYVLQLCPDAGAMELGYAMYAKGEAKKLVLSYI